MAQKVYEGDFNDKGPDSIRGVPEAGTIAANFSGMYGNGKPVLPLLVDGDMNPMLPAEFDDEYRSPEELAARGMPLGYTHTFKRDPNRWDQLEHRNEVQDWMRRTPGSFIPLDKDGKPFVDGDRVLAFYPEVLKEKHIEQKQQGTAQFDAETEEEYKGDIGGIPRWNTPDIDIRSRSQEQHMRNVATGMIGAYPGMKFEDVLRSVGQAKFEEDQEKYRSAGQHRTSVQTEQQEARMQAAKDQQRGAGGKFVSIPSGVKPRNLQGANR